MGSQMFNFHDKMKMCVYVYTHMLMYVRVSRFVNVDTYTHTWFWIPTKHISKTLCCYLKRKSAQRFINSHTWRKRWGNISFSFSPQSLVCTCCNLKMWRRVEWLRESLVEKKHAVKGLGWTPSGQVKELPHVAGKRGMTWRSSGI